MNGAARRLGTKVTGYTAFDMFSGCGGLTLGLKRAGFLVVGAVDIHQPSVAVYRANHPEVRVWRRDVLTLSAPRARRELQLRSGQLDLLAGCPPCRAFSTMRTLNGGRTVRDSEKDLLFQILRFVKAFRPKAVMIENVPGLAADKRVVVFCARLARLGYESEFRVLDAAHFGVPQRRRRMILLASREKAVKFARRARVVLTVRDAIVGLPEPGNSGDPLHDFPEKHSATTLRRIKSIPHDGGSRNDLPRHRQLACHRKCDGFKDVYGRMSWQDVAPTITTGCFNPSKGRFLHPTSDRAVTMREAAILQGFPRRYRFPGIESKCLAAVMIGNALPPAFIARHALCIRGRLNARTSRRAR
jgi:DNA (cytosine-5)-methyltransferase 1